jgi:hypothetical protein
MGTTRKLWEERLFVMERKLKSVLKASEITICYLISGTERQTIVGSFGYENFFLSCFLFLIFFLNRVLLGSPCWPGIPYIA